MTLRWLKLSRPRHTPTKQNQDTVALHASVGTPQDIIAQIIGISTGSLVKHYRQELDLATVKANATVGGALFNKAISGDTVAMIFWMKTRAGWSEVRKNETPTDRAIDEIRIIDTVAPAHVNEGN